MSNTIDFYFDFGSPTAYLAWTQLKKLSAETGAELVCKPVLLGGIFKATGNSAPAMVPAKGKWLFKDIARFVKRYGVDYHFNSHFPVNTLAMMRLATGIQLHQPERLAEFVDAMYQATWVDDKNTGDPAVIAEVATAAGFDAQQLAAYGADQTVKDTLKAATAAAVERGLFGCPTMFVGDEMFFGQDRLDFVREALN